MKRVLLGIVVVTLVLAGLSGCRTLFGRGRGPVETIAFLPQHNSGLSAPVVGSINQRPEPKEVTMVVPPGTNMQSLVASITLNTEASVAVISTGRRVTQFNNQTPNDFSVPVTYSFIVPGDDEPWLYRVAVREAHTDAALASVQVSDAVSFEPRFTPQIKSYTVTVPYSTRELQIAVAGRSPYLQRIVVDGAVVRSSSGVSIGFESGDSRELSIETLAEDRVSEDLYRLTLVRAEPDRNPVLADLSVPGATLLPAFRTNRLHYATEVPYEATEFTVIAQPQSRFAQVSLNAPAGESALLVSGDAGSSRGATVSFRDTDRLRVVVSVRAEDGTLLNHTLDVRRAAPPVSAAPQPPAATPSPAPAPVPAPSRPAQQPTPAPSPAPDSAPAPAPAPTPQPPQQASPQPEPELAPGPETADNAMTTRVAVNARNVQLGRREADALGRNQIAPEGQVTLRRYRSDAVLAQGNYGVNVQRRGNNPPVISFTWDSPGFRVNSNELVEVEIRIPTGNGNYLHYTEAFSVTDSISMAPPFFLFSSNPRVTWPAPGSTVAVDAEYSLIPPGQIGRGQDGVEELPRSVDGARQAGVQLTVLDADSGSQLFSGPVRSARGIQAGRQLNFDQEVQLTEGRDVRYEFVVRGADGRGWRTAGHTTVWTTRIAYDGGYSPALLFVLE
ncbi:MAG: cadherin-like beta sandwich domain-containing protein [Spirochaeta sp.]|nr:cadherin-like beta sandwich domain-containing protein [Spirochaeta sp.]